MGKLGAHRCDEKGGGYQMFLRKTRSIKTILAGTVPARAGAVLGVVAAMSLSPASAGMFDNVADAIVCPLPPVASRPGGLVVF